MIAFLRDTKLGSTGAILPHSWLDVKVKGIEYGQMLCTAESAEAANRVSVEKREFAKIPPFAVKWLWATRTTIR
jgi:hypothetical protein